jgi:hypothetical protein
VRLCRPSTVLAQYVIARESLNGMCNSFCRVRSRNLRRLARALENTKSLASLEDYALVFSSAGSHNWTRLSLTSEGLLAADGIPD